MYSNSVRKLASTINGKKGGRPSSKDLSETQLFDVSDKNLVILTKNQYETLIERYGYAIIEKALLILNLWLKSSPVGIKYKGKNNYAHFRSDGWLINMAKNID